jgi:c-di-GMP-binding flagellar brake protein YcgR
MNGNRGDEVELNDRATAEAYVVGRLFSFRTVIVKVCETELWLGLGSPDRRLGSLRWGQTMRLAVVRQGTALMGTSEFLRPLGESRSRIFAVTRPLDFEPVQRRAYVRYEIDLPVRFRRLDPRTNEPRGRSGAGTTVNLSPGGLLLRTDAPVSVGDELDLSLPLSGGGRISTSDRVLRVMHRPPVTLVGREERPATEVAVEFIRITGFDREQIVRFVLAAEHRRREAARQPGAAQFTAAPALR